MNAAFLPFRAAVLIAALLASLVPVLAHAQAPVFTNTTSDSRFEFQIGVQRSYVVLTSGTPTPVITIAGPLPPGVLFLDRGDGSATIAGTAERGTQGSGPIVLTATNSAGSATRDILISVVKAAEVVSDPYATFVVGKPNTFYIYSDAEPQGTMSLSGTLPAGVVLQTHNLSHGELSLSGTPGPNSAGVYPLTVTATNALGSHVQTLVVSVLAATPGVNDRNYTGMYYNTDSSGYAMNLTHQGNTVVVAWYAFAQNGRPVWFVAAATRQGDGSFQGDYSVQTGVPFNAISNATAVLTTAPAGTVNLKFAPDGKLRFRFNALEAPRQETRDLGKLVFDAAAPVCRFTTAGRATATNYSDLWWQPIESGWGLSVVHQGNLIYIAWYTYAADGQPVWMVSLLTRQEDGSYSGSINRAGSGVWYVYNTFGPVTNFPLPVVGTAVLRFTDGEHGSLSYTIGDVVQTKPIERIVFGSPAQVCAAPTP